MSSPYDAEGTDSNGMPDWRRNAQAEVLLSGPAPTAADIIATLQRVLGDIATISAGEQIDSSGEPFVNVDYRGVALVVRSRAEALSPQDVPEGEDFNGGISFPQSNPSFNGPLNASRGLVVWGGNAGQLLRTTARIHVAGAVYAPDEQSGKPVGTELPLDALREELAVATITSALTILDAGGAEALGVWVPLAGLCVPADVYRDTVSHAPMPVPILVGLRVGVFNDNPDAPIDPENPPLTFAFTTGMARFGRADLEFPRSPQSPPRTMGTALDVLAFELGTSSSFLDGEVVDLRDGRTFDVRAGDSTITGWHVLQLTQLTGADG